MTEKVLILDFGSQFTQLIARRVRELNVYCEIIPYNKFSKDITDVQAVILSGSPLSVNQEKALIPDMDYMLNNFPTLGICYGAQLMCHQYGGKVERCDKREYGKAHLIIEKESRILENISEGSQIWMSHGDSIVTMAEQFEIIASTDDIPVAGFRAKEGKFEKPVYGFQFHPEVYHTKEGLQMISNFILDIAGFSGDWTPASFVDEQVAELKQKLDGQHVVMGLSGGVDSTVAAELLHRAIGDRLHCIFIDNGLLRLNEFEEVLKSYEGMGLNITGVRAADKFIEPLLGESDPEKKRKIIGGKFIDIFQEEANKLTNITYLGQGTIYPDVIESVSVHGPSVTIKSHHNVGGLPDTMNLKLVEPLRMLFKDEVRRVGAALEIPKHILSRHPFPGPGLGIRILGGISREKIRLCQEADDIYIKHLKKSGWYDKVWQAGAILLPVQSVGVMGDERTYEFAIALRCVNSVDGMTAEWSQLPYELLAKISSDIINKVTGINRVVYDISTKPPATIEWE